MSRPPEGTAALLFSASTGVRDRGVEAGAAACDQLGEVDDWRSAGSASRSTPGSSKSARRWNRPRRTASALSRRRPGPVAATSRCRRSWSMPCGSIARLYSNCGCSSGQGGCLMMRCCSRRSKASHYPPTPNRPHGQISRIALACPR